MAVLCPRYKFAFVHIPRTGGTSVETALGGRKSIHHTPLEYINGHRDTLLPNGLGWELWNEYHTFTIVRNPFDQVVSLYEFLKRGSELHKRNRLEGVSFDSFVEQQHKRAMRFYNNSETLKRNSELPNFKCEGGVLWPWVCDWDHKIIVSQVLRFETLEQDFAKMCDIVGLPGPPELPHVNAANSRKGTEYRNYYTADSRRLVAEMARHDMELFGYDF
jgi:hypothetical protein